MDNSPPSPFEYIRFLSASPARLKILRYLREEPSDPRNITNIVSKSHRCVQRDLAEFVDRGWVVRIRGVYHLTTYGEVITIQYGEYFDDLSITYKYEPFFRHLPDSDCLPNPRWLHDAELAIADTDQPYGPLNLYVDGIRECSTESISVITPSLSRIFNDIHAELLEQGVKTELIVDTRTLQAARSMISEKFASALRSNVCDLCEYEATIEFGLTLMDDRGFMSAYDEQGRFSACVEFENIAFFEWAEALYGRYGEHSRLVALNDGNDEN